jgi:hypothetical protein
MAEIRVELLLGQLLETAIKVFGGSVDFVLFLLSESGQALGVLLLQLVVPFLCTESVKESHCAAATYRKTVEILVILLLGFTRCLVGLVLNACNLTCMVQCGVVFGTVVVIGIVIGIILYFSYGFKAITQDSLLFWCIRHIDGAMDR